MLDTFAKKDCPATEKEGRSWRFQELLVRGC